MIPSMTALVPTCRKIALLTAIDRAPVRCRMTDHHRGPCVPASLDRRWPTGRPIPTTFGARDCEVAPCECEDEQ